MALYALIDCGTTNSRVYIVNGEGDILASAKKTVGCKDTAVSGSNQVLLEGLREIAAQALEKGGFAGSDISAVFSSGMITSELGLAELPHLVAPAGPADLADSMEKVDVEIIKDTPVYFVRGIKNPDAGSENLADRLGGFDFMRGEEVQLVGLTEKLGKNGPYTAVILSSHTKFVAVDADGVIGDSLTTISGQLYAAIKDGTFLSKSLATEQGAESLPEYLDEGLINAAVECSNRWGFNRSLMYIRFMDTLMESKWYERRLFLNALIANEDMKCLRDNEMFNNRETYVLVGDHMRCRVYDYLLRKQCNANTILLTDTNEIDRLAVEGILSVARTAGIV